MPVNKITPQVGATGVFLLDSPYSEHIPGTAADSQSQAKNYTCIAVRRFKDIVGSNSNIKQVFYDNIFGSPISEADFQEQEDANVSIITLRNENGVNYYVPDSYILSVPITLGYPYANSYITLQIKSHFLDIDLEPLSTEISELVKARLGYNSEVSVVTPESITYFSEQQHVAIENNRQQLVTNTTGYPEQLSQERTIIAEQAQVISLLYAEIDSLKQGD